MGSPDHACGVQQGLDFFFGDTTQTELVCWPSAWRPCISPTLPAPFGVIMQCCDARICSKQCISPVMQHETLSLQNGPHGLSSAIPVAGAGLTEMSAAEVGFDMARPTILAGNLLNDSRILQVRHRKNSLHAL